MLPTQTLNPTKSDTADQAKSTGKAKRDIEGLESFAAEPLNKDALLTTRREQPIDADKWWWIGVGMTTLGGVAYYYY